MHKKRIWVVLLITFPLLVGLACRFSSPPDPNAAPATQQDSETDTNIVTQESINEQTSETTASGETQDLLLHGQVYWMQDGLDVFVAFFFENPNSGVTFENVNYNINLLDASGNEFKSKSETVRWIFPYQTFGIASTLYLDDESQSVDSVSVDWEYSTGSADGLSYPFTIKDTIFWQNEGYPVVTGIIDNNSADTFTNIKTNIICFNNAGDIVGGGYSNLDFIPGSDFMGFATDVITSGDVAYVEVYPTFTYESLYYEGTDFWSEITVLDDYFYTDDFGSLHGGVIIKNNIDVSLSDSVAYITFYDDSGRITSVATEYIDLLLPGDTLGFSTWAIFPPEGAITSSYDILVLPGDYVNDYELTDNPFQVNSATLTGDNDDYVAINFTNTYSKQVSQVNVYVLVYDSDGNIIGGGRDWTSAPTPAGGSTDIKVWVGYDSKRTVDSIDVWIYPSQTTEFE